MAWPLCFSQHSDVGGSGRDTSDVFDLLYPFSSPLSIYPSRSGWGGRKGMPPSNPSLEEMGDSDSGPKHLGQEGVLLTFHYFRSRSVDKSCTVAYGPYLHCSDDREHLLIQCVCASAAERQHVEGGIAEPSSLPSCTCHPSTCPLSCLSTLLCDSPWPTDH